MGGIGEEQGISFALILGDNEISREGLKRLLIESGLQAECRDIANLPDALAPLRDEPDQLILVDAQDPGKAIAVCKDIKAYLPHARLVVIGDVSDIATAKGVFSVGADGYLTRQLSYTHMMLMLELVGLGEKVVPKEFITDFVSHAAPAAPKSHNGKSGHDLSDRERSILQCLVGGDPNKVIGRNLGITEATVKVHVKSILRKLNLTNRTQAAIWVVNNTFDYMPEKAVTDG